MELKWKIKTALDETRMLILGGQILLGFQYRVILEKAFRQQSQGCQQLMLAALLLMLVDAALLITPGAYHRVVWGGADRREVHRFTTRLMDLALLPFALAFAVDLYVVSGAPAAVLTLLSALAWWFGPWLALGRRCGVADDRLKDQIDQALTEIRVVLPGAQALLGFQLGGVFTEGFAQLPPASRQVHLGCLFLMVQAVILLMSPSAYHRLVLRGEIDSRLQRYISAVLMGALLPLALSMSGDLWVVSRPITGDTIAWALALLVLGTCLGLWFGYTFWARWTNFRTAGESSTEMSAASGPAYT